MFSPRENEFVYVVHSHKDSVGTEPDEPQQNSDNFARNSDSFDMPECEHHRLHADPGEREADESRVALLDTACAACIHSKRWRQSYERTLPTNLRCEVTPQRKHFHFANGQSTEDKLPVWRIPIFLGGRLGEIYSAE